MKRNNQENQKSTEQETKTGLPRQVWPVRQIHRCLDKKGFGLNEVIGIAAGIIIAVVVVIPGLRGFAGSILDNLTSWWNGMAASVFATP
jgi:hypothetical protein